MGIKNARARASDPFLLLLQHHKRRKQRPLSSDGKSNQFKVRVFHRQKTAFFTDTAAVVFFTDDFKPFSPNNRCLLSCKKFYAFYKKKTTGCEKMIEFCVKLY